MAWTDGELFVLEKPAGMPCVGEARDAHRVPSLVDALAAMIRGERGGRPRAWVGPRLDDEASGLVLLGGSARSGEWVRHGPRATRSFVAVVEGDRAVDEVGSITLAILDAGEAVVRVAAQGEEVRAAAAARRRGAQVIARQCATHYRVLASGNGRSLVRLRLDGESRHQARAHLASIGLPIVGDLAYGATADPLGRVALHCCELAFAHPGSGESVRVRSEPPRAWRELVGERPTPTAAPPPPPVGGPTRSASDTSWDRVAGWYDDLVEQRRNDLLTEVVHPGVWGLLEAQPGERVLDLACGQGAFARLLAERGARVWGIDASPRLIAAARARSAGEARFEVGDATRLGELPGGVLPTEGFDAVVCVMALMNLDPLDGALAGAARVLRPGGRLVAAILHPAFRNPGASAWGWDREDGGVRQFRRVDGYMSSQRREIVMNPGEAAHGGETVVTWTYHRPLSAYAGALAAAGLVIEVIEEWVSPRQSEPGPRADAENLARREIPMFLALRARKLPAP